MNHITMNNWVVKTSFLLFFYFFSSSSFALDHFMAHTTNKSASPGFSQLMLALQCNNGEDIFLLKNGEVRAKDFADFVLFADNEVGTCVVGVANETGSWEIVGDDPLTLSYRLINVANENKAAVWQFQSLAATSPSSMAKEYFFLMNSESSKGVYEVSWKQSDIKHHLPPRLILRVIPNYIKPQ